MVKSSPEKLAEALRANLRRRKQGAPARTEAGDGVQAPPAASAAAEKPRSGQG